MAIQPLFLGSTLIRNADVFAPDALGHRDLLVGGPIPFRGDLTAGTIERFALGLLNGTARVYWSVASRLI